MTYYQSTAAAVTCPELTSNVQCDVCIIGAGYAGLACAAGLIERGNSNVVVIEAEQVGFGASGRNGGFVFGGFSLGNQSLLKALGPTRARNLYQLTLDGVELIRKRIDRYAIPCDINQNGVLLANWFDDPQILSRAQQFMHNNFSVDWELWSMEQTRAQLHTHRSSGALHEKNAFHFHPLKYAHGLASALTARGLRLIENSRAISIDSSAAEKIVHTEHGQIRARQVVVCCGGYIGQLVPELSVSVLPVSTFAMATEPLGERLQQAMTTSAAVYDTRFAFDYYRGLADTRLLWGGRISIFRPASEQVARLLYRDMLKVYPQLEGVRVEHAWSGQMSYARHQMPQIGQLANGIWYAMGFGGHGISTTTLAGEVVSDAITHNRDLPAGLENFGLPRAFGLPGLLAVQCTYWYYELRDLVNRGVSDWAKAEFGNR